MPGRFDEKRFLRRGVTQGTVEYRKIRAKFSIARTKKDVRPSVPPEWASNGTGTREGRRPMLKVFRCLGHWQSCPTGLREQTRASLRASYVSVWQGCEETVTDASDILVERLLAWGVDT